MNYLSPQQRIEITINSMYAHTGPLYEYMG